MFGGVAVMETVAGVVVIEVGEAGLAQPTIKAVINMISSIVSTVL
jgi:hypothetical protein